MELPPIPDQPLAIYAVVRANDSLTSELEQALRALVRAAQSEPGTLEYGVWRDPDDSNVFHVYEKYFGREAFQEHIGNETFKEFAGENCCKAAAQRENLRAP